MWRCSPAEEKSPFPPFAKAERIRSQGERASPSARRRKPRRSVSIKWMQQGASRPTVVHPRARPRHGAYKAPLIIKRIYIRHGSCMDTTDRSRSVLPGRAFPRRCWNVLHAHRGHHEVTEGNRHERHSRTGIRTGRCPSAHRHCHEPLPSSVAATRKIRHRRGETAGPARPDGRRCPCLTCSRLFAEIEKARAMIDALATLASARGDENAETFAIKAKQQQNSKPIHPPDSP